MFHKARQSNKQSRVVQKYIGKYNRKFSIIIINLVLLFTNIFKR